MTDKFEEKYTDWLRKGDFEKVNWVKNIDNTLLPSLRERVKQNDKTILREIVLPKWVDWNLLREIVDHTAPKVSGKAQICILCDRLHELGIAFNKKFVCESCFLKMKSLDVHTQLIEQLNPVQETIAEKPKTELEIGPTV